MSKMMYDLFSATPVFARTNVVGRRRSLRLMTIMSAVSAAFALLGCHARDAQLQSPEAPEVSVAPVVSKLAKDWLLYSGGLGTVETVDVRPRVTGFVERIAFKEGELVRQGEPPFRYRFTALSSDSEHGNRPIGACERRIVTSESAECLRSDASLQRSGVQGGGGSTAV